MTAASQSESAPLVEMMLESARREAEAGAYDYAIEYVLAVIAVEPKLVVPRLQLQELALSLLSSPQLHEFVHQSSASERAFYSRVGEPRTHYRRVRGR